MAYYKTAQLGAQAPRALALTRDYFIYQGFLLQEVTASGFRATRPPRMAMHNNPLGMITEVRAEQMGGALTLEAKLGGQKWIFIAVVLFVLLICGLMILDAHGGKTGIPIPALGGPLFVIFVIAGVFNAMQKAALKLLDNLLANAAKVSELR